MHSRRTTTTTTGSDMRLVQHGASSGSWLRAFVRVPAGSLVNQRPPDKGPILTGQFLIVPWWFPESKVSPINASSPFSSPVRRPLRNPVHDVHHVGPRSAQNGSARVERRETQDRLGSLYMSMGFLLDSWRSKSFESCGCIGLYGFVCLG